MKQYGANKATEISKKQIGVIYGMAKKKELSVSRFVISNLYDLADYYGFDDNGNVEREEMMVMQILDNVFAGNINDAQIGLDSYAEHLNNVCSRKVLAKANMELV